ncbi:MAG: FixH family protein [Bacteroidetes bacterium]|nr:FixH family protein [Bacteroidota bacterium]
MIKKLNWGWRIAGVYLSFVVFIIYMVYRSVNMKTELVTADYYAEELNYQEHINKLNLTQKLSEQLAITVQDEKLTLSFPKEVAGQSIKADIYFYCPSNSKNDYRTSCRTAAGICEVNTTEVKKGGYKVKVNWSAAGADYYNENFININ